MGNHEYCVDCGENDFHHGRPCDPKKVAERQSEEKSRQAAREAKKVRSMKLAAYLRKVGLLSPHKPYFEIDEYGNLEVGDYTEGFETRLEELHELSRDLGL